MLMCLLPCCHTLFTTLPSPTGRCQKLQSKNKLLWATWVEHSNIPAEYFVWLDESSVDDHTNQCTNGWLVSICACVYCATFIWGPWYSVLPALTSEGYIAFDIFEDSINKERFISWKNSCCVFKILHHLWLLTITGAQQLTPYPGPWSVVVLDNCMIHHDEEIHCIIVE